MIYACLASLGCRILAEDATTRGRMELILLIEDRAYIFEFKVR